MSGWIGTCSDCGRLVHADGWFRKHPAGGVRIGTSTGTGCKYAQRPDVMDVDGHCGVYGCWAGDCTQRVFTPTGWRHYDCGVAEFEQAPLPSDNPASGQEDARS